MELWASDADLAWRAQLLGWRCVYEPAAVAWHVRFYSPGHPRATGARGTAPPAVPQPLLMIAKNETAAGFARDVPFILGYEVLALGHALLRERTLLPGYATRRARSRPLAPPARRPGPPGCAATAVRATTRGMSQRTRVLSIDGGGIRGMIPALVLAEIERRAGKPAVDQLRPRRGHLHGRILACGADEPGAGGRPRYAANELAALYEQEGPNIFDRSLLKTTTSPEGNLDERYPTHPLQSILERYFGKARLREALTRVLVPRLRDRAPHAVVLPLRAREGRRQLRLPHGRGRACHVGGADVLRARQARCPRRSHGLLRPGRRRRVRGQPGHVRVGRGARARPARRHRRVVARHSARSSAASRTTRPRTGA